jgi:hypothetical protein
MFPAGSSRAERFRLRGVRELAEVALLGAVALACAGCGVTGRNATAVSSEPAVGVVSTSGFSSETSGRYTLQALPLLDRGFAATAELDAEARDATTAGPESSSDDAEGPHGEADHGGAVAASSGLSVGGLATQANSQTVDGVSAWQSFGAGPRGATAGGVQSGTNFAVEAVRGLRSGSVAFGADAGGSAASIDVESRSGGEKLHGSLFALVRESAWAAANPFSIATRYAANGMGYSAAGVRTSLVKPEDSVGQFGGAVGGRLTQRGRVRGFGSLEAQLRSNPVESAPAAPEFFTLSAMQLDLLGRRGVTSAQTDAALGYLDSLMGVLGRSSQRWLGFGRMDAEPSSRDHVTAAWVHNRFRSPAGTGYGSASDAVVARGVGSLGDANVKIDAVTGAWQHAFSRGWGNDLRGQVARDLEYEQPRAPLPQEPAIGPGGSSPEVAIAPEGFTYGTPASLGRTAYPDEQRIELVEQMEWVRGHHAVRVGGDWSRITDLVASQTNADGTFSYDSGVTGGHAGGLVDWITDKELGVGANPNAGCPSVIAMPHRFCFRSFSQTFGGERTAWATHEIAAFAEDAWHVSRTVSITAGIRWEYTLLPLPQAPNPALDTALRSVLATDYKRAGSTAAFPEDRNNFGPRLGVSWKAPLGFTARLGFGAYFGRVPGATVRAALEDTALASTTRRVRITPTVETACPQVPSVAFGYPCDFVTEPPAAVTQTASAVVFARGFRVPVVQRFGLSLEHRLGRGAALTLRYSGSMAEQLPGSVDLNLAPATSVRSFVLTGGDGHAGVRSGEAFTLPAYTDRLIAQYGPVSAVTSTANASYHALAVEAHGAWRSVTLRAGYAWSHAIDDGPQLGATPRRMTQLDPFADGYDKGRSTLDFTHHFAGTLVAHSAWARGPDWERRALSHWSGSAIGVAGSGAPYSYTIFGGTYLSGGSESINGAGGATYLPSVGRNTLRLPMRGKLDLRIAREATLAGRWHVEAFAEAFNALNTRNLTAMETRAFLVGDEVGGVTPLIFQDAATVATEGITTPAFGTPTSSTAGLSRERQVEFGLRARF